MRTGNNSEQGQGRQKPYERSLARPAPTVDTKAGRSNWKLRHPGRTYGTVQGTPRIAPPGHHEVQFDGAVPVELWELGVLQGFPPDYPSRRVPSRSS